MNLSGLALGVLRGFELSTSRSDVDATTLANGAGKADVWEDAVEGIGGGIAAFGASVAFGAVERDEIDVRIETVK